MNAYRVDIWCSVKHNDKFIQNSSNAYIIHARNEEEARSKVTLRKGYTKDLPGLKLEVSNETIYSSRKVGTVIIEPYYVYSDGNNISVAHYKARIKKENQNV